MTASVFAPTSEWLSPMIIKELRQGLHSKLFITFYLLLQGLLAFSILLMPNAQSAGNSLFWFTVVTTLVIALPARGLVAVHMELRARTMELLYLTRLSTLRIILGKWGALFLQSILCAVAILPYLFVRYLLGGQEIVHEGVWLAAVLLLSALCMALTVSFSALSNWWGRVSLSIIAFSVLALAYSGVMDALSYDQWLPGLIFLLTSGVLLIAICLIFGASLIASSSENHTLRLRLLALLYCLGLPLVGLATGFLSEAAITSLAVLILVSLSSLLVQQVPLGSHLRPFSKFSLLGRWASLLLSPGWASGLCYTLVLFAALTVGILFLHPYLPKLEMFDALFYLIVLLGTMLFPLALILLFQPVDAPRLLPFVWAQISMIFCYFFILLVEQALETGTGVVGPIDILALLPTATLLLLVSDNLAPLEYTRFCYVNLTVTALAVVYLLWRARPGLSEITQLLQRLRAAS